MVPKQGDANTHLTLLTSPPFRAQRVSPFELKATDIGNSPPLPTREPTFVRTAGSFSSILKRASVLDPAWTPIQLDR